MAAGLIQLIAIGNNNDSFAVNYSLTPYNLLSNSDNPLNIIRNYDSISINGFVIKSSDINNIKNFQILFGNNIVYSMPMNLLLMTSHIIYDNNNFHIIFDKKLFFNDHPEIIMIALQYMQLSVVLKTRKNISIDYDLMLLGKQYQTEQRRSYAQNKISNELYQYETFKIKTNEQTSIDSNCIATNIFVETRDPITNFRLSINGLNLYDYSTNMIIFKQCLISKRKIWTKKHSLTLKFILGKYIPVDIINEIESYCVVNDIFMYCFPISSESWRNSDRNSTINFSRIHDIKIFIGSGNNKKCKVHIQNYNILHYVNGMANIEYNM